MPEFIFPMVNDTAGEFCEGHLCDPAGLIGSRKSCVLAMSCGDFCSRPALLCDIMGGAIGLVIERPVPVALLYANDGGVEGLVEI
jgi:hypothetical protein